MIDELFGNHSDVLLMMSDFIVLTAGGAKPAHERHEGQSSDQGGVSGSETDGGVPVVETITPVVADEQSHAHVEYEPDTVIIEAPVVTSKPAKKSKVS